MIIPDYAESDSMYYRIKINLRTFLLYTVFLLLIPLAACFYLYAASHYPQFFTPCILKTVFHLYCPGCGGTHAVFYLLHFQLLKSLLANPLVLYGAIVLLYYWIRFFICLIQKKGRGIYRMNLSFLWILLFLLAALLLLRNLLLVTGVYDFAGELISYWKT